ncbi:MAG: rhodanese-like domain-containing protein [Acidobacteriota bacterium]
MRKFLMLSFLMTLIFSLSFYSFSQIKKPEEISLSEAKEKYDKGGYLFVDARSELVFKLGHIKGAVNLPVSEFSKMIGEFEKNHPKDTKIIVYCSGSSCASSYTLANYLINRDYTSVEVFFGGWNSWVQAKYPIERTKN